MTQNSMYPINLPYSEEMLNVGSGHELYIAQFGNPQGMPVLCLHGGPGAGHIPQWQAAFNPEKFRIVMYDQRGCGKSMPFLKTEENTIDHLVEDIEKIRIHLGIEKWAILGGSWGASLALFYAEKYADRISHMILRGVFLATKAESERITEAKGEITSSLNGYFERYRDLIPPQNRESGLAAAYNEIMQSGYPSEQREAAIRFMQWDYSCAAKSEELARELVSEAITDLEGSLAITKLFMHFACTQFDDTHKQRLLTIEALKSVQLNIIHGRHDMICEVSQAMDLHAAYPHSSLTICENSGHSSLEPEIMRAHIKALEAL